MITAARARSRSGGDGCEVESVEAMRGCKLPEVASLLSYHFMKKSALERRGPVPGAPNTHGGA